MALRTQSSLTALLVVCLLPKLFGCSEVQNIPTNKTKNYYDESIGFIAPSGNIIARWVPISPGGNLVLRRPEPAGLEESNPLYVCRTKANNNRNKPGKLLINEGRYDCSITEYGEIKRQNFDLLETAPGATSWVPKTDILPSNAIVAGSHPHGNPAYVCRATNAGALLVGALDGNTQVCFLPRAANEHIVLEDYEILVVNAYGLVL